MEKAMEFVERIKNKQKEVGVALKKAQKEIEQQVDKERKEVEVWKVGNKMMLSTKYLIFK